MQITKLYKNILKEAINYICAKQNGNYKFFWQTKIHRKNFEKKNKLYDFLKEDCNFFDEYLIIILSPFKNNIDNCISLNLSIIQKMLFETESI